MLTFQGVPSRCQAESLSVIYRLNPNGKKHSRENANMYSSGGKRIRVMGFFLFLATLGVRDSNLANLL